jgi:hypothetical protein
MIRNGMKVLSAVVLMIVSSFSLLFSQSVYLPATHRVYKFLDKMEAKEFLRDYRDEVKPITRERIAGFLIQLDSSYAKMTDIEQEEFAYYKEEFFEELKRLNYDLLLEDRWHLYRYESEPGLFNVDLIGGWEYQKRADGSYRRIRRNGLQAYGYVGNSIGAYFYYHDNRDAGTYLDILRTMSPEPAEVISRTTNGAVEYDNIDVQLTYRYSFLTLSVEKMHNVWGNGDRGQLILSNKSPSFPQIKLQMKLGKDVDFTYLHGWLYSGIVDSLRSYQVSNIPNQLGFRTVYKQKYIAAQMLEMTPWNGVDLAIGESEIYGNRNPELLYLIPFMFFKGAEHWMYDTDNSQIFASFDFNVIPNYNFYTSVFIDEFSTEKFYSSQHNHNQLGFTVGAKSYDLLAANSMVQLEYTRINPWVYNHKYPEVTYQSHYVDLGHWIGQNADLFYVGGEYQFLRNLTAGLQFQSVRKGAKDSTVYQYQDTLVKQFLYSPLTKEQSYGVWVKYEPLRDLFVDFDISRNRYTTQNPALGRDYSKQIEFSLSIMYNVY